MSSVTYQGFTIRPSGVHSCAVCARGDGESRVVNVAFAFVSVNLCRDCRVRLAHVLVGVDPASAAPDQHPRDFAHVGRSDCPHDWDEHVVGSEDPTRADYRRCRRCGRREWYDADLFPNQHVPTRVYRYGATTQQEEDRLGRAVVAERMANLTNPVNCHHPGRLIEHRDGRRFCHGCRMYVS